MAFLDHSYYHRAVQAFLSFVIPRGQRVLVIGPDASRQLAELAAGAGASVTVAPPDGTDTDWALETAGAGPYDYIAVVHALGDCPDLGVFLGRLAALCVPSTRVIVISHSYFWAPALLLSQALRLKRRGGLSNVLSARDLQNYMASAGFEQIRFVRAMLCPVFAFGLGPILNVLGKLLPALDFLKLSQYQVFRPVPQAAPGIESLTVCVTCRDEAENIEPLVKAAPILCDAQELLFVEGHSRDGTREEIERVKALYPEKHVRLIGQPGIGQGDAIREGFANATGEIIILLEADMTTPPQDIVYVYEAMRRRYAEFVEGTRFTYRLPPGAMPLLNQAGNWFFGIFFSFLAGQHITDVLGGIKAIRKSDFEKLLGSWGSAGITDPFGDFELLFGAMRLGLRIAEQPIHYLPRPYGTTKTRVFRHGAVLLHLATRSFSMFRG